MTPSMRLSEIVRKYVGRSDFDSIKADLDEAMHLGHAYGMERAAKYAEDNRGQSGIGLAHRLRALAVIRIKPVATTEESF